MNASEYWCDNNANEPVAIAIAPNANIFNAHEIDDETKRVIEPPAQFQDSPSIDAFASEIMAEILSDALEISRTTPRPRAFCATKLTGNTRLFCAPDTHLYRPVSRNSCSSRLSSSHNSLNFGSSQRADDSTFITQAVSHDMLVSNADHDSDIYTLPVDVMRVKSNRQRKRRRNVSADAQTELAKHVAQAHERKEPRAVSHVIKSTALLADVCEDKRPEPIHMTLQEVRQYLETLYSDTETTKSNRPRKRSKAKAINGKNGAFMHLKRALCNLLRRFSSPAGVTVTKCESVSSMQFICDRRVQKRALPPLPVANDVQADDVAPASVQSTRDVHHFTASIHKVKDYGWYWGPISGEAAEKILSNEPDGSFIVRDSSDDHYIFSLSFKLNSYVRHVRIEHDQGNFSFGSCTKFKSHTIVEFIENAVAHSRSGRYLFFLHRRPVLGPMRVQLLHPVSRFKQVQSLQHMCRFVILKVVRRDLVGQLPLPRRIIDYLNAKHYYSEQLIEDSDASHT